jgi:hypothetical protein
LERFKAQRDPTVKLKVRDIQQYEEVVNIVSPLANPIFSVIDGDIESWETVH